MNILQYRRNQFIFMGMIYLNIYIRFSIGPRNYDNWTLIYYLLLNFLWVDLMRVMYKRIYNDLKNTIQDSNYDSLSFN